MDILKEGLNFVKGLVAPGEPETIREQVIAPASVSRQPAMEPDDEDIDLLTEMDLPNTGGDEYGSHSEFTAPKLGYLDSGFDPGKPEDYDMKTDEERSQELFNKGSMADRAGRGIIEKKDFSLLYSDDQVLDYHLNTLKKLENGAKKGFVKAPDGDKFMPIASGEGEGPDKGMSTMEIGYGTKIPDKWLSTNKEYWPIVDGVKIDVSKGITEDQELSMRKANLDKSYKAAAPKLKAWKDMTGMEKMFWGDLSYNGGAAAIDKNPKAKAAANEGRTIEAMVLALDYIKSAGKASRGLLNRRVSMYNQAALENTGAPVIEEYEFGETIKVKFSTPFMTNKVGRGFAEKINKNDLWYTVTKGSGPTISQKADKNFNFEV